MRLQEAGTEIYINNHNPPKKINAEGGWWAGPRVRGRQTVPGWEEGEGVSQVRRGREVGSPFCTHIV